MPVTSSRIKRLIEDAEESGYVPQEEIEKLYGKLNSLDSTMSYRKSTKGTTVSCDEQGGQVFMSTGHANKVDISRVKEYLKTGNKKSSASESWFQSISRKFFAIGRGVFNNA